MFRIVSASPVEEKILARATDKKNLNGLVVEAGVYRVLCVLGSIECIVCWEYGVLFVSVYMYTLMCLYIVTVYVY